MEYIARHTLILDKNRRVARGTRVTNLPPDEIKHLLQIKAIEEVPDPYRAEQTNSPVTDTDVQQGEKPVALEQQNTDESEEPERQGDLRKATPEEVERFRKLNKEALLALAEEHEIFDLSLEDTRNDIIVRLVEAGVLPA